MEKSELEERALAKRAKQSGTCRSPSLARCGNFYLPTARFARISAAILEHARSSPRLQTPPLAWPWRAKATAREGRPVAGQLGREAGVGKRGRSFFPSCSVFFALVKREERRAKRGKNSHFPRSQGLDLPDHPEDTSIAMRSCSLAAQSGSREARRGSNEWRRRALSESRARAGQRKKKQGVFSSSRSNHAHSSPSRRALLPTDRAQAGLGVASSRLGGEGPGRGAARGRRGGAPPFLETKKDEEKAWFSIPEGAYDSARPPSPPALSSKNHEKTSTKTRNALVVNRLPHCSGI